MEIRDVNAAREMIVGFERYIETLQAARDATPETAAIYAYGNSLCVGARDDGTPFVTNVVHAAPVSRFPVGTVFKNGMGERAFPTNKRVVFDRTIKEVESTIAALKAAVTVAKAT